MAYVHFAYFWIEKVHFDLLLLLLLFWMRTRAFAGGCKITYFTCVCIFIYCSYLDAATHLGQSPHLMHNLIFNFAICSLSKWFQNSWLVNVCYQHHQVQCACHFAWKFIIKFWKYKIMGNVWIFALIIINSCSLG